MPFRFRIRARMVDWLWRRVTHIGAVPAIADESINPEQEREPPPRDVKALVFAVSMFIFMILSGVFMYEATARMHVGCTNTGVSAAILSFLSAVHSLHYAVLLVKELRSAIAEIEELRQNRPICALCGAAI